MLNDRDEDFLELFLALNRARQGVGENSDGRGTKEI